LKRAGRSRRLTSPALVASGWPGTKAGQRSTVKIDTPGVYLIRLETRNTQSDHEQFAATDLIVGEAGKP
jgi:hypothetical protein